MTETNSEPQTKRAWSRRRQYEDRVYIVRVAEALMGALAQAKARAKRRGSTFALTRDDIIAIVERQNGRCDVTGLKFDVGLPTARAFHAKPFRPSLDQRKAGAGYTIDNCRIVCFAVNAALGEWGDAVFLEIARAAVNRAKPSKLAPSNELM